MFHLLLPQFGHSMNRRCGGSSALAVAICQSSVCREPAAATIRRWPLYDRQALVVARLLLQAFCELLSCKAALCSHTILCVRFDMLSTSLAGRHLCFEPTEAVARFVNIPGSVHAHYTEVLARCQCVHASMRCCRSELTASLPVDGCSSFSEQDAGNDS